MKFTDNTLSLVANTIRGLAMDGIQKAKSGHPGAPMGLADIAAVLWLKHLKHNPADSHWIDRDRFILSGGHGSMLLYSLLHLAGYKLPLDELKRFRQLDSLTPGHPEYQHTDGVETTTGPLGQGLATGVGMAIAEQMAAARYNVADAELVVDHRTWIFCGDGDLEEGISHEACSLAGHLKLDKLVLFYDSNDITIEGCTSLALSDDARKRFEAYNWHVLEVDGHDYSAIDGAICQAMSLRGKPTVIICRTTIGKGSPNKAGTAASHGAPLGAEEVVLTKAALGMPTDKEFYVPEEVYAAFRTSAEQGRLAQEKWHTTHEKWATAHPEKAAQWAQALTGKLPDNLEEYLPVFDPAKPVATRSASGMVLNALAKQLPSLVGGSADLSPSNMTWLQDEAVIKPGDFQGRNFHFGVRELAMSAIMNGIQLHGGFRIFGGTFFVFSDYCRPSLRLAAIMGVPVIFVFTHDSFYVGEDGPTHEPVEQLMALRCMPGITVIRPADPTESGAAWIAALKNQQGPTALLFTRQNMSVLDRSVYPAASMLEQGAYTLWQSGSGTPELMIIATGSEVEISLAAAKQLTGVNVRVVSMPSWELFDAQPESYRNSVIDPACERRLIVEAGVAFGWERYMGNKGAIIALNTFGASAPFKDLAEKYGFTVDNVLQQAQKLLA